MKSHSLMMTWKVSEGVAEDGYQHAVVVHHNGCLCLHVQYVHSST